MMTNKPIPAELFAPADRKDDADKITRPTIGFWKDVLRRLLQNKLAMFGFFLIVVMLIMAFLGPQISGYSYFQQELTHMNIEPNGQYWFGTDTLGRDLFTRICFGIRYSLLIGILAAAMDFVIGVSYGGIAGMASSKVDTLMMRIAEIAYAIPYMLIVILISVTMGKDQGASLYTLVLAMSITGWVPMAIMVRGQVLQLRENEYCLASQSLGGSKKHILTKHIIPNTLGPILVNITLSVPRAIFAEATLSFMGLGLQPPQPSLGVLATDGLEVMGIGLFYQMLLPALFISLIMFSFNVFGDGLQDALDPRLRK
ncbi:Oligopeptide transport system permease protein oppC [Urinicoccus massiliensis]|uniref:Oligopeptide transport system permease protein oppC n=2 Tax=Urinicoccus massiliensis TaxID=1723382 RepID=A0A8H2QXA0_9FIRM|nr:ABC transporter permease [Urinicoccus massiliensis]KGF10748.1 diguanylate cyclase [Tissierellia bacterium S5-A11]VFB15852.1 Oligopeptide transport system permease protein oppC [Urinicoccus massiliensis]